MHKYKCLSGLLLGAHSNQFEVGHYTTKNQEYDKRGHIFTLIALIFKKEVFSEIR